MSLVGAITDLFLAFGAAPPERVSAFTKVLTAEDRCTVCLTETLRRAAVVATRMPAPSGIIGAYNDHYETHHFTHLGVSEVEASVGRLEAAWRSDAVKLILPYAQDRELASFIAAQMWWSRVSLDDVAEQVRNPMWVDCAATFLATRSDRKDTVEKAWTRARSAASFGSDEVPMSLVMLA